MRPFVLEQPSSVAAVTRIATGTSASEGANNTKYLAGGTTLIDLMKLDVMHPRTVVDINPLQQAIGRIEVSPHGLRLGALVRMAEAADHPEIRGQYPVLCN